MARARWLMCVALAAPAVSALANMGSTTATAAQPSGASEKEEYHVVELFDSDTTTAEQLLDVFTEKLGATREQALQLAAKVDANGKAVVLAGGKEGCEEAAAHFKAVGMETKVRPLVAADMQGTDLPSEYDGSDVVVAGGAELNTLLDDGLLVVFTAPWCGHCKAMVPELKQAASELLKENVRVASVNTDVHAAIAQQLGVASLPAIKWMKRTAEGVAVAEHVGERSAAALMQFALAAHRATLAEGAAAEKAAVPAGETAADAAAGEAASASKLSKSKVSGAATMQKAAAPAAVEDQGGGN